MNIENQVLQDKSNDSTTSPILASAARNDVSSSDIAVLKKVENGQNRTHQGSSEKGFPIDNAQLS